MTGERGGKATKRGEVRNGRERRERGERGLRRQENTRKERTDEEKAKRRCRGKDLGLRRDGEGRKGIYDRQDN